MSVHVGPDFGALLAVAFIVLKLTGVIHWGWLWVLAPIWMPIIIVLVVWAIVMLVVTR